MFIYYTLQGVLLQSMIFVVVEHYTNNIQNRVELLQKEGIPIAKYYAITFLSSVIASLIEELIIRYLYYNKICTFFFSSNTSILIAYFSLLFLFTRYHQLTIIPTIIYLIQAGLYVYLYQTTGTLLSPILINAFGRLFR